MSRDGDVAGLSAFPQPEAPAEAASLNQGAGVIGVPMAINLD